MVTIVRVLVAVMMQSHHLVHGTLSGLPKPLWYVTDILIYMYVYCRTDIISIFF